MSYEEAVQAKQEGKIGFRELVEAGPNAKDYAKWCREHGVEPNEDNAEFYLDMTEDSLMNAQELSE